MRIADFLKIVEEKNIPLETHMLYVPLYEPEEPFDDRTHDAVWELLPIDYDDNNKYNDIGYYASLAKLTRQLKNDKSIVNNFTDIAKDEPVMVFWNK